MQAEGADGERGARQNGCHGQNSYDEQGGRRTEVEELTRARGDPEGDELRQDDADGEQSRGPSGKQRSQRLAG